MTAFSYLAFNYFQKNRIIFRLSVLAFVLGVQIQINDLIRVTMIKLVSFKNCPFVQRVMGALVMKNVPFEIEYIELNNKPQWFLDISPNGQVPVLITENETVLLSQMQLLNT